MTKPTIEEENNKEEIVFLTTHLLYSMCDAIMRNHSEDLEIKEGDTPNDKTND